VGEELQASLFPCVHNVITSDIASIIFNTSATNVTELARLLSVARGWHNLLAAEQQDKANRLRESFLLDRFWLKNRIQDSGEEGERFSFGALVPCSNADGGGDWFTQHCNRWGTKWDVCELCECQPGDVSGSFDTAWGPPIPWLATVAVLFPEIRFTLTYEEPGCDFAGVLVLQNGEEMSHNEYTYRDRPWGDTSYSEELTDDED